MLTLPFARTEDQPRLEALFALQLEIRRIPGAVSEPPLGEIRLQWWRDALDEIIAAQSGVGKVRAHPVIEALHKNDAINSQTRLLAEKAIDAQAPLIYKDPFENVEALSDFAFNAEGQLIVAALGESEHASIVEKAARAYALAKIGLAIPRALAEDAKQHALELWKEVAPQLRKLDGVEAGRVLMVALTHGYLKRMPGTSWPLIKRMTLFRTMMTGLF